MKKIVALLLIVSLLACSLPASFAEEAQLPAGSVPEAGFSGMNDPNLLRYTEDTIYENLVATLDSDEYFVENVSAVYISQEYIDELAYNSQANIYFGYTLQELAEQFQGKKYIFTLGDDGSTIVTEFEEYDDTYDRALKNVAIGTGVILVCVTVSVVTAGTGASAIDQYGHPLPQPADARRQHDLLRGRPKRDQDGPVRRHHGRGRRRHRHRRADRRHG